jgi:alpha-tubulin suppressor-like RCC1 family protein
MARSVRSVVFVLALVALAVACEPVTPPPPPTIPPYLPAPTSAAVQVSVSSTHGCALLADGTARCWGNNRNGQLGNGTLADADLPAVVVTGVPTLTSISAGDYFTCAIVSGGGVECWGINSHGELGNGTTTDSATPVTVLGIPHATSVSTGAHPYDGSCATLYNGTVKCWGSNYYGQLGNASVATGSSGQSSTPVTVTGVTNAVSVSMGLGYACALISNGTVQCWGRNDNMNLGNPSVPTTSLATTAVPVVGLTGATSITAGSGHTCALTSSGTKCWGSDYTGQLGDGGTANSAAPVAVTGGHTFSAVSAGDLTCAIESGAAWCWGINSEGQTGDTSLPTGGTLGDLAHTNVPVPVTGLGSGVTHIMDGITATCAARTDATVWCWGNGLNGAVGNESNASTGVATLVRGA